MSSPPVLVNCRVHESKRSQKPEFRSQKGWQVALLSLRCLLDYFPQNTPSKIQPSPTLSKPLQPSKGPPRGGEIARKLQASNPNHQRSSKFPTSDLDVCSLDVLWSLDVGIWMFSSRLSRGHAWPSRLVKAGQTWSRLVKGFLRKKYFRSKNSWI